jgi:hypothetical protein
LSGQKLEDALRSGAITGLGSFTGANVARQTQSPMAGRAAGALTSTALAGGDLERALQSIAASEAIRTGMDYARPTIAENIENPIMRRAVENVGRTAAGAALSGADLSQAFPAILASQAVGSGLEYARPHTADFIPDPTARKIAEQSAFRAAMQNMYPRPSAPTPPAPVPGIVQRRFSLPSFGQQAAAPLAPTAASTTQAPLEPIPVAKGGYIKAPVRRNISELIPLRPSGLSALRGA